MSAAKIETAVITRRLFSTSLRIEGWRKPHEAPARRLYVLSEEDWTKRYTRMIHGELAEPVTRILAVLASDGRG